MSGDVFVSYAREDLEYVAALADHLKSAGVPVWLDDRISPSSDWVETLEDRLESCACVVVVMSQDARKSRWVKRELLLAEELNKPIFPLLLHGSPFAQLIDTQYHDVSDRTMPAGEFSEALLRVIDPSLRIRDLIEELRTDTVLILGRFTPDRKVVLDRLKLELLRRKYVPVLFDFELPAGWSLMEVTVTLALISRFIVVDLTDTRSQPQELQAIVPTVRVPVVPLIQRGWEPYAMFADLRRYDTVLELVRYDDLEHLLSLLDKHVIEKAEAGLVELGAKWSRLRLSQ